MNIVYFDVESQKLFQDVGGRMHPGYCWPAASPGPRHGMILPCIGKRMLPR